MGQWPARRKAAVSSNDSIRRAVQVLALLHPSISFTITDLDAENHKPVLFTNNHASILDRFRSFYGRALVQVCHDHRSALHFAQSLIIGYIGSHGTCW